MTLQALFIDELNFTRVIALVNLICMGPNALSETRLQPVWVTLQEKLFINELEFTRVIVLVNLICMGLNALAESRLQPLPEQLPKPIFSSAAINCECLRISG